MKLIQGSAMQLQNHVLQLNRSANELAMSSQRFSYTECLEVRVSAAQANGTQGLMPLIVTKESLLEMQNVGWKEGKESSTSS